MGLCKHQCLWVIINASNKHSAFIKHIKGNVEGTKNGPVQECN